ncbi:MAG TPA: hypothetical protein DHV59_04225 [Oxalobacteraceae bacterium]|nr:hypothetical protein [Oxalobacteraceae bacterium]
MTRFAPPAISTALLHKAGRMLGIAMIAFLAACTRSDDKSPVSQNGHPVSGAAQKDFPPLSGLNAPQGKRPTWTELTPAQRQVLAPLADEWNSLPPQRKKKWLEIAAKYAQMSPAQQQRMQTRMREWTQLSPQQRRIARESYARAKKLDPDQKSAKWEHYQSLPAEEKQKLAAKAEKKKNVANLPRPQSGRPPLQNAKPVQPVLPSAAPNAGVPVTVTPPPTTSAPVQSPPAGIPNDFIGDPMSAPSR